MKTAEEMIDECGNARQGLVGDPDSPDDACYADFTMVEIDKDNLIDLLNRFADQFKPKWNEFKEVGENDPEHGEIVVVSWPPEQMCDPEIITWGVDDYEVIHGCEWLSISKLLPLPTKP